MQHGSALELAGGEVQTDMSIDPSDVARRARDRALVEAHCSGDPDAFPAIVRDHYAPLLATAQRRLGSRVEAEDAVQEAFERAYRGLCRVNGEYRIGAWLHRVLTNVCIDHATRRQVQRSLPDRIGPRLATVPDPAEHASDPVVFAAVQAAIDALPASQRQTFLLHEVDGLSYLEVAEHLGISEDNARARVHRAKVTLRARLARVNVAAILAIPAGLRLRFRRPASTDDATARPPLDPGHELAQTATAPGRHSVVTQAAYSLSTNPVAELAASSAPGGSRLFVVVAASVATAIGGMIAVPSVTGQQGAASAPAASVATPSVESIQVDTRAIEDALAAEEPLIVTVPSTEPPAASGMRGSDWISAGATLELAEWESPDGGDAPVGTPRPGASPAPVACPWVDDYPDILTPPSAPSSVAGTFDRVEASVAPGPTVYWWSDTTLRMADTAGGPAAEATTVTIGAQACLERGRAALVVDVEGLDGQRVQLRGARVLRINDDVSVFRGRVVVPADAPNVFLPWHLPERFVARLEVSPTGATRLDVAFMGDPSGATPPEETPTTTTPTTPTTTTPPPTTSPPVTTPTTEPPAPVDPLPGPSTPDAEPGSP